MDLNPTHGTRSPQAHERYREAMADLVRRTRDKVQDARDSAQETSERTATRRAEAQVHAHHARRRASLAGSDAAARVDTVEISGDVAALAQAAPEDGDEAVRSKVERLKEAYRAGTLHTPERVERAAQNLLRGTAETTPPNAG